MSRPTKKTPEISAAILNGLAEGRSLSNICKSERMPSRSTVHSWIVHDDQFQAAYVNARKIQAEVFADEIIEIADGAKPKEVQRAKLRIDARKWHASKLAPAKYGPIVQDVRTPEVAAQQLSDEEHRTVIDEFLQRCTEEERDLLRRLLEFQVERRNS